MRARTSDTNAQEQVGKSPYPVLDGPTITCAYRRVLRSGARPHTVLDVIRRVSSRATAPVVVVSYWDTVADLGPEHFADQVAAAGAAGCMVPDLHETEADRWAAAARQAGLYTPRFAPHRLTPHRLNQVVATASGWIHTPAAAGALTSDQAPLNLRGLRRSVGRLRRVTTTPIVTGVGVSTPTLAAVVRAVFVGTPFVRLFDGPLDQALRDTEDTTTAFAAAVHLADRPTRHRFLLGQADR